MHQSYSSIALKSSLSSSSYGRIMNFGAQICGKNSPIEEVTKRPLILGSKMSLEFKIGRRESLLLLPLLFVGPISARGETAPMGADTLDRPGFRQYQDLTKQEPSADSSQNVKDMTIPVNGRQKKLSKLLGSRATIVMNVKLDDPETTAQVPALRGIVAKYAEQGLTALCFPTDQGDYEPDDSTTVRIKVNIHPCTTPPARSRSPSAPPHKPAPARHTLLGARRAARRAQLAQQYGLTSSSKGPVVVTDKTDLVGRFAHPLYRYLTASAPNPNNVSRITLNYEKFLLGPDGQVPGRAAGPASPLPRGFGVGTRQCLRREKGRQGRGGRMGAGGGW